MKCPKTISCLKDGLKDLLSCCVFPLINAKKISSINMGTPEQGDTVQDRCRGDIPERGFVHKACHDAHVGVLERLAGKQKRILQPRFDTIHAGASNSINAWHIYERHICTEDDILLTRIDTSQT